MSVSKVIGRCCSRSEFGARALGNRSIIADPRKPDVIKKINEKVKSRDFWMPFAPSIMSERQDDYLVNAKGIKGVSCPSKYYGLASAAKPVIGVLESQGTFLGMISLDNQAFIPLSQFERSFWNNPDLEVQVKVKDLAELDDAREELRGVMRRVRGVAPGKADDFAINQQDQFVDLCPVGSVCQAAGAETVTERQGQIVLPRNLDQAVVMLEQRVLGLENIGER